MYQVDGFEFATREEAKAAKKEQNGVSYIRSQTNLRDPDTVLKLYRKLITDQVFSTPVGIAFLKELQGQLMLTPYIKAEDIIPIPVQQNSELASNANRQQWREHAHARKQTSKGHGSDGKNYRTRFYVALFFSIVFGVAVLGMYAVTTLSGNNVNILNYEESIINKYENWESDLQEREQQLRQREDALPKSDVAE